MKYRKKPVVIEAIKWRGDNFGQIMTFMDGSDRAVKYNSPNLIIETLEGAHTASPGDYIIKGVHGEFYPCKPDIFDETYDMVNDQYEVGDSENV